MSRTTENDRRNEQPGMPGWVKGFAIAAAILAVVIAAMLLMGGGHGPGRHMQQGSGPAPTDASTGPRTSS